MPILKVKENGVWKEISGASWHQHTMSDITNFPSNLPADVLELQNLVGEVAVANQIETAVATKADADHVHDNILQLFDTISGVSPLVISNAVPNCELDIVLTSEVYSDFSSITVSVVKTDEYMYNSSTASADGIVYGLSSFNNFTLSAGSTNSSIDMSKIKINCTYPIHLNQLLINKVIHADEAVVDDTLSKAGCAADAKVTGDAISNVNNELEALSNVAFSGSYNDLNDKPTIPSTDGLATEAYVNEKVSSLDILEQVQADWTETDESSLAYIKNKPNISVDGTLPVPETAKVGQYLQISGVDESGAITSMTTVDSVASSWSKLADKPFYAETVETEILAEQTFTSLYLAEMGCFLMDLVIPDGFALTAGENYIVYYDGTEFPCVCFNADAISPGAVGLGNGAPYMLPGNGEPFVIGLVAGDAEITVFCITDTQSTEHTIAIRQEATSVKMLDTRFLEPFTYTEGGGTDLLSEQTLPFADIDDGSGMYNAVVQPAGRLLTAGETYAVIWDGVEYTFVCQNVSIGDETFEYIGNMAFVDGEETEDPMGIAQFVMYLEDGTVVYVVSIITLDTSESHTIALRTGGGKWVLNESALPMEAIDERIEAYHKDNLGGGVGGVSSWEDLTDKPFTEVVDQTDILPEMAFTSNLTDMGYGLVQPSPAFSLVTGESYLVSWDGEIFPVTALDATIPGIGTFVSVGNGSAMGYPGNGEPFAICVSNNYALFFALTDTDVTDHNVRIYQAGESVWKLDEKCLPMSAIETKIEECLPFGEKTTDVDILTEQELTLSSNGAFNVVQIDAIDLVAGEIYKVIWNGEEYSCECLAEVSSGGTTLGGLMLGNVSIYAESFEDTGEPFLIAVSDGATAVCASDDSTSYTLAITKEITVIQKIDQKYVPAELPAVNTSDAGKFLRVSADGIWVAETIPNAEEASF